MRQRLFKISVAALMLVLVSGLCACKSTEAKWQEQYDLGMKYVSEGNYEEAIIAFAAAIEIDPNNADAYIGRADAYLALGNTEENLASARADYEKAAELSGMAEADSGITQKIAQAYESLADGYIDGDDWNKAVEILQQELEACGETENLTGKLAELGLMVNENGEIQPDYYSSQGMRVALIDARDTGSSDNYYLTDTQREEILRPMISKVRYFYEYGKGMNPDEPDSWEFLEYGRILAGLYYIMGELEQCLEVRAELYQQTGEEYLNPEGYVSTGSLTDYYNSYGVMVRQEGAAAYGVWLWEYDQMGKPLGSTTSYGDGRPDKSTEILYENGRIVKEVFHSYMASSGDGRGNVTYTPTASWWDYEYGEGQVIIRNYDSAGELSQIGTVTLNEYGFEEETQWEDLYLR